MSAIAKCPICKKPVPADSRDQPFCSSRCRNVDLGRWLGEAYRVSRPATEEDEATLPRVSVVDDDGGNGDEGGGSRSLN